jgi:hypothetical protein
MYLDLMINRHDLDEPAAVPQWNKAFWQHSRMNKPRGDLCGDARQSGI